MTRLFDLKRTLFASVTVGLSLVVSGCGFQPVYHTANVQNLAGLTVVTGPERMDFLVQNAISDFAGPGDSPYRLRVTLQTRQIGAGLSASGVATRMTLRGTARYRLIGGREPIRGVVRDSVTYDTENSPYALIAARSEAEERLAQLLAERVLMDVSVALRDDLPAQ